MNKKQNVIVLLIFMSLLLVACKGTSSSTNTSKNSTGTTDSQGNTNLSKVNTLVVGTLKLEDTDQAVTADESAKLLPLWQAYRSLSNNQTSAEAEVDGLLKQIEDTMTSEQTQAITAMNLTSSDMVNLMQSMNVGTVPSGTPNPVSTPNVNTSKGGVPSGNPSSGSPGGASNGAPSGGGPSGGPPSGSFVTGGGPPGGDAGSAAGLGGGSITQGTQDPSAQATAQTRFTTQANQVNAMLLDVLINKLEAKTKG